MKICTLAVFFGLVAAAYSTCSNPRSVAVGPTVQLVTGSTSVVGPTITCADNPSLVVVNAELDSPVVSSRYIVLSIEYGCDGSRTLRAIDSVTGNVICLPIFYEARVGLYVVVLPLSGEIVYFAPNSGCNGFTLYLVYLNTLDGSVYLLEVLTGNVYLAQIGCYGDVILVPVSTLPSGLIQLRREVRVDLVTIYGVQRIYVTDLYTQATFTFYLYESNGLLITSDNVFGFDYVLRITDCNVISLDRLYLTLSGTTLIKTVDSTFVRISRSLSAIDYITTEVSFGVMPYVKATTVLRASIIQVSTTTTLEITNVNSGITIDFTCFVGLKDQYFVIDSQGNQFFVYTSGTRVTLFSVYRYGELMYVVNADTKQIQLIDVDSCGNVVFYPAESITLSSLILYRIQLTYRLSMSGGVRYLIGEDISTGYNFKTALRMVDNLFICRDELIQITLIVIDTDVDVPTVQQCWETPGGIMVINQINMRLSYITYSYGKFVYTDIESGATQFVNADSDFLYFIPSSCTAVC